MPQEKINDEMYKTPKKKSRLKTVMLLVGGVLLLLFIASAFIGGLFMADEFDALRDKTAAVISGDPVEEETDDQSEEAETEPEVVERVVEVEKEMDWYTYEDASIFGGITFRYPEVFQVRTDFDGDSNRYLEITANIKDSTTDKASAYSVVLFSETESNITYTPGEPESINPAEFPPIEILGSVREVEHYILGEGSFGHGYFNDNYNMVINDEFYIRVDSVKAEASPYCVEDANPPDCTTDEYEYITPEIYIEYARQLLESLGMLETE